MGLWTRVRLPPIPSKARLSRERFGSVLFRFTNLYTEMCTVGLSSYKERCIMPEQKDYCVDGYRFASVEDSKEAQVEKIKADYFDAKLQGKNIESMLAVYDKVLDEKIFETPLGWEYLRKLQRQLRRSGAQEEQIRPIPLYLTFTHKESEETEKPLRVRVKPSQKVSMDKRRLQTSVIINILLVILVIAMFAITLNSNNPNILNYRKQILNEYASWEQELTQREQAVKEKESSLGME